MMAGCFSQIQRASERRTILLRWKVSSLYRAMSESDVALYLVDAQTLFLFKQSELTDHQPSNQN